MIAIGRYIEGISINGKEYILDDNGDIKLFQDIKQAELFLLSKGIPKQFLGDFDYDELSECLECKFLFTQNRDLQVCDKCINEFDLERLWKDHDNNKIDALDFNERKCIRERYRR